MRALCRRLMRPRAQRATSLLITAFAAYAAWSSDWGASESALLAAMAGVTAFQWRPLRP